MSFAPFWLWAEERCASCKRFSIARIEARGRQARLAAYLYFRLLMKFISWDPTSNEKKLIAYFARVGGIQQSLK